VARTLAPLLGRDADVIEQALRRDAHFVYLARQLDYALGERIMGLRLPGIDLVVEPKRVYPAGSLAAQIVGFTDIDGKGLEGLELVHDDELQGRAGTLARETAPQGLTIAGGLREVVPPEPGTDVVLTIDREIQAIAEDAAMRAVEKFDAIGASVVVMEAKTGDVLAMASVPTFDPADRDGTDLTTRRNRSVTDVLEPGSVQKAVTIAGALEDGIVTPSTRYEVDDRLKIGSKTFSDAHDHPTEIMSVADILEQSSNVGTMLIAQDLGAQRLHHYLRQFGYGQTTGIGFPGESPGIVLPLDQWWVTSLPTIAIGQGVAMTLLQAATTYATFANDGVSVQPRILRGTVGPDGRLERVASSPEHRVVSVETARSIREMLELVVVGDRGTGAQATVSGYSVGGKTGTARKPLVDARGYSSEYIATFVGLAPIDDPELVVAVMVDEPYPIYGGVVAAPVFSEVMGFALRARQVRPDRPIGTLTDALQAAAAARAEREGPATNAELTSPAVGSAPGTHGRSVGTTLSE
jgi:cell division protein FtsI (penicillin-binding protein 3)